METECFTTKDELPHLARMLGERFFPRRDIQARQLDDGHYVCIHRSLKPDHLVRHLKGDLTLGTYLLDETSRTRFIVFDADDEKSFDRLVHTARMLAVERTPAYLEASRRGGHLWLFFGEPLPGKLAREFGRGVQAVHQIKDVELYPKQDQLGKGPGSLIRAPFGVHRLNRQRYDFLDLEGRPLAASMEEQIQILTHPRVVPMEVIKGYAAMQDKTEKIHKPEAKLPGRRMEPLSEQIKARVSVMEFIGRYVELKSNENGAIGLCPFHPDRDPSLGVNQEGNYWYCFAGCGGGSVIDFWMKWRGCDFKTAVGELAGMILN